MSAGTCDAARVSAVLAAYNSAAVIGEALRSLPDEVEAFVVDNCSSDETASVAVAARPRTIVVAADANRGFGAACNLGLERATREFVVFVNPDLEVGAGGLETCVALADAHPEIVALGAGGEGEPGLAAAPSLSGAFLFARAEALRAIEGFDTAFFLYFDDEDLCLRLRQSGAGIANARGVVVRHEGAASTSAAFDDALEKAWLWGGSCRYFADKHAGTPEGARAARKLAAYRRKSRGVFSYLRPQRAANYAARVAGAEAVRRHGPETMRENAFTGAAPRAPRPRRRSAA
jgi:glycosyltransferase involved in cell wall biosynthesis